MTRLFVCALLLVGCSSSSSSGGGDLSTGGGATNDLGGGGGGDLASAADLANYQPPTDGGTFKCGASSCGAGTSCCVVGMTAMCQASCPDGGFTAECNGPADCGGNPCCITIASGFQVTKVACTNAPSACPPMVDAQTQSGQDRACHADGDCTAGVMSPSLPDCCTNTQTMQHVCFNKSYVGFVPGWTCP